MLLFLIEMQMNGGMFPAPRYEDPFYHGFLLVEIISSAAHRKRHPFILLLCKYLFGFKMANHQQLLKTN